jgi:hypothetical protein
MEHPNHHSSLLDHLLRDKSAHSDPQSSCTDPFLHNSPQVVEHVEQYGSDTYAPETNTLLQHKSKEYSLTILPSEQLIDPQKNGSKWEGM